MKLKCLIVAVVSVLSSVTVFAETWLDQEPPPKQMYRDINSQAAAVQQPEAQSTQLQSQQPQQPAPQAQQQSPLHVNASLSASEITAVQLSTLSNKVEDITNQLTTLNQKVSALSQTVAQSQSTPLPEDSEAPTTALTSMSPAIYASLGGGGVLLGTVGFLIGRTRRKSKTTVLSVALQTAIVHGEVTPSEDQEIKTEYDYMGTNGAIPAMVDLARSYLAMDKMTEAKVVLEKVLLRGDKMQRQEAKTLLDEIAK